MERRFFFGSYNVAVAHGARLVNASGLRFMDGVDPERKERGELPRVVAAAFREILEERGPVFLDLRHVDDSYWTDLENIKGKRHVSWLLSGELPDPKTTPIAIEPVWFMFNVANSGLQIDLACHTNVPGLYAAGAAAKNTACGTHSSAGIPTAFCFTSGFRAGEAAAAEAARLPPPSVDPALVERLRQQTYAPLLRRGGTAPDAIHDELARIQGSSLDAMVYGEMSLCEKLRQLDALEPRLRRVRATDWHDLVKAHEAEGAFVSSRLVYLSALDRTESREQFYREDYPETDDAEWFCWHVAQRTAAGTEFSREPVALESYALQPPKRTKRLSPVGAIMRGGYDPADYD